MLDGVWPMSPLSEWLVGLIEVAGLVNDLEDGCARAQKVGRVAGAFNLAVLAARHSGGVPEMALDGSSGKRLVVAQQDGLHRGILRNHTPPREPGHEGLRVLEIRQLPAEALEPKDPSAATGTFTSRRFMRR